MRDKTTQKTHDNNTKQMTKMYEHTQTETGAEAETDPTQEAQENKHQSTNAPRNQRTTHEKKGVHPTTNTNTRRTRDKSHQQNQQ
jgi:hypothetical protein